MIFKLLTAKKIIMLLNNYYLQNYNISSYLYQQVYGVRQMYQ